jgi:hypothetical protein
MEYHEHVRADAQGRNQRHWAPPDEQVEEEELALVFAKFDRFAMGVAGGTIMALGVMFLTLFLVIKGGAIVGPNLELLNQYFPGYRVTTAGAFIGAAYAFVVGGVAGWTAAAIRNVAMFVYWIVVRRHAEHAALRHLMDIV